ncbi:hypothetical protein PG996_013667 [Apiospora saccharicola]|uniref:SMODS and SLOG-associating 2TM effector domain-containing protein n=1 Tax=Apiospora saccharicola TaxID=335842 RepID=A0ABR1U875_9PEZI
MLSISDIFTIISALASAISSLPVINSVVAYAWRVTSRFHTAEMASKQSKRQQLRDSVRALGQVPTKLDTIISGQAVMTTRLEEIKDALNERHDDIATSTD